MKRGASAIQSALIMGVAEGARAARTSKELLDIMGILNSLITTPLYESTSYPEQLQQGNMYGHTLPSLTQIFARFS